MPFKILNQNIDLVNRTVSLCTQKDDGKVSVICTCPMPDTHVANVDELAKEARASLKAVLLEAASSL